MLRAREKEALYAALGCSGSGRVSLQRVFVPGLVWLAAAAAFSGCICKFEQICSDLLSVSDFFSSTSQAGLQPWLGEMSCHISGAGRQCWGTDRLTDSLRDGLPG